MDFEICETIEVQCTTLAKKLGVIESEMGCSDDSAEEIILLAAALEIDIQKITPQLKSVHTIREFSNTAEELIFYLLIVIASDFSSRFDDLDTKPEHGFIKLSNRVTDPEALEWARCFGRDTLIKYSEVMHQVHSADKDGGRHLGMLDFIAWLDNPEISHIPISPRPHPEPIAWTFQQAEEPSDVVATKHETDEPSDVVVTRSGLAKLRNLFGLTMMASMSVYATGLTADGSGQAITGPSSQHPKPPFRPR